MAAILLLFTAVGNASKSLPAVPYDVLHLISMSSPPTASKFRGPHGEKLAAANAEFAALEVDGMVHLSTSLGHHRCIWCKKGQQLVAL